MSSHSGGGGGDLLSLICPELGVTPQVDPGTDLEDELSIPASPPADVNHVVVSLSVQTEMDSELEQVFVDVGSLPTMVTPVCDPDWQFLGPNGIWIDKSINILNDKEAISYIQFI